MLGCVGARGRSVGAVVMILNAREHLPCAVAAKKLENHRRLDMEMQVQLSDLENE